MSAGAEPTIGKTARGHAVYTPNHPSYAHLEKVRMVGADTTHLGQLARQAQPHYRAVDHEEASAMHYARRNFHAARAHEAASAAMSKADGGMVPAYASNLAWVYQGADPGLSLDDAAGAIRAVTLTWSAQDHLDHAVLQHCLAQAHGEADTPEDLQRQALCAAAAFMHFAAAGVDPTTGPIAASAGKGPVAKSLAMLAKTELGKSAQAATEAELAAVVRKAFSPKALTPIFPRKASQIGTTRSGKAIFDIYHHPAHKTFDAKDWADAGNAVAAGMKFHAKVAARKRTPVTKSDVVKGAKPLGAAFSHARKVAAKTGGGKAKERAVAQRYLSAKGHGKMAKAEGGGDDHPHIGTTSSGKKVYGVNHPGHKAITRRYAHEDNHAAITKMYPGFTAKDHQEAAYAHKAVRAAHFTDKSKGAYSHASNPTSTKHFYLINAHLHAAHKLSGNKTKPTAVKPKGFVAPTGHAHGEGSRGGHVVGHSKTTGEAIYATHGAGQEHYTGKLDEPKAKTKKTPEHVAPEHREAEEAPHARPEGETAQVLVNKGDAHAVVGKTRSGKDIHASHSGIYAGIKGGSGSDQNIITAHDHKTAAHNYRTVKKTHQDFTAADHTDARDHFKPQVRNLEGPEKARAIAVAHAHEKLANEKYLTEQFARHSEDHAAKSMGNPVLLLDLSKARGKGSRGGVIIGFAPNGSPIYSGHRVRSSKARKEAITEAKKEEG